MVNSTAMSNEEYQLHMDELAMRISEAMKGERIEDALSACAANIGFGMTQLPVDQHDKMRVHLGRIIEAIIAKVPRQ
jgi:cyanophycinase-like exopeptidase